MKHLFIVGVGRSGTSLLQSMFAAHPSVAMLPETGLLRRYVFGPSRGPIDFHDLRAHDHRLQRIPQACWDTVVAGTSPGDLLALYGAFHRSAGASCLAADDTREIEMVGDKDPRLIEYLPAIARVFPDDTYVIHIVRDPRDVLLSKIKAGWSEKRNWRLNLGASRFQLELADRFGKATFGERWITIRYEDLIADPQAVLTRVTATIGVGYDPQMLRFSEAARSLSGGEIETWKKETLGPLLAGNRDKW
nr:sulfotransferase [Spirochaeta sp.]